MDVKITFCKKVALGLAAAATAGTTAMVAAPTASAGPDIPDHAIIVCQSASY